MKCGWVFVPLCSDKRCCTLNCKYCQIVFVLPLKKIDKVGTLHGNFVLCVHRRGCGRFVHFEDFSLVVCYLCFLYHADCTVSLFLKVICARRSVPWEGLYFLQKLLQSHGIHPV